MISVIKSANKIATNLLGEQERTKEVIGNEKK